MQWVALAVIVLLLQSGSAMAQRVPVDSERRVALVIGNSGYTHAPLRNPANDAADVAAALREQIGRAHV